MITITLTPNKPSLSIRLTALNQTVGLTLGQAPQALAMAMQAIAKGEPGRDGQDGSATPTFESISKNLQSWQATLNYTAGNLTSIVYTNGSQTVTKTFNYTAGALTSITLSGDVPTGIALTKTFNYTSGALTSVSYT